MKNKSGECVINHKKDRFPHSSTMVTAVNYAQSTFFAYRDLARHMTRRISYINGNLVVDSQEQGKNKERECPDETVFTGPEMLLSKEISR